MKPVASPLDIIDFAIIKLEFNFVPPEKDINEDLRKYFSEYPLDIDFTIHNSDSIQVVIKAAVNTADKKLPGYSILAEAACLFEFNKKIAVTAETRKNIEGFSTIYIALNVLRSFISQVTSNGALGKYILPSIDLNDLITQKKNAYSNNKGAKKPTPKKK